MHRRAIIRIKGTGLPTIPYAPFGLHRAALTLCSNFANVPHPNVNAVRCSRRLGVSSKLSAKTHEIMVSVQPVSSRPSVLLPLTKTSRKANGRKPAFSCTPSLARQHYWSLNKPCSICGSTIECFFFSICTSVSACRGSSDGCSSLVFLSSDGGVGGSFGFLSHHHPTCGTSPPSAGHSIYDDA